MATVSVFLLDEHFSTRTPFGPRERMIAAADAAWGEGRYKSATKAFESDKAGVEGAEEAFDVSNNPERTAERYKVYGYKRSVSVGDIVKVDEEMFLCLPSGWAKIQ